MRAVHPSFRGDGRRVTGRKGDNIAECNHAQIARLQSNQGKNIRDESEKARDGQRACFGRKAKKE